MNIVPGLVSLCEWEEKEVLLLEKIGDELLQNDLILLVYELHPFDLPKIIGLPITKGSQSYLDWILRGTSGKQNSG